VKLRSTILFAAGLLTLTLFGIATAGPLEDGNAAAQRGDYAAAMRLLRPLADQGSAGAQYDLGVMYANGQGVPQNYTQAVMWYRKAADGGDAGAQNDLGVMYANGYGVPQNYAQALMWFNLAASPASDDATRNEAVKTRDLVAAKMTPAQIAEAQRIASEWVPK
jgi:TPR repeat protein